MAERIVSPQVLEQDVSLDAALRPKSLDEFINQERVVEPLRIFIQAARERGEALDHVLLYGPPGLGKSTLCHCIAHDLGVNLRVTSGPAIERAGDLAAILTNLQPRDILFIDEIHRLSPVVEEYLYPALESFKLDIVMGKGPSARSIRLALNPFTLVGATTRMALMTAPLRARFGVVYRLDFFQPEAMVRVVERSASILAMELDAPGALEIARRARGTPRVANRLLKRVRDYAQVHGHPVITREVAEGALALLEVDPLGLDEIDRKLLHTIAAKFGGGPVGLETIAAAIGEEADTIMDVCEPYLLQLGFLGRTPRGRVLSPQAYEHLELPQPAQPGQHNLF